MKWFSPKNGESNDSNERKEKEENYCKPNNTVNEKLECSMFWFVDWKNSFECLFRLCDINAHSISFLFVSIGWVLGSTLK